MKLEQIIRHIDTAEWHDKTNPLTGKVNHYQELIQDDDTGMFVRHFVYPAGYTTPTHIHHCGHGIFVLKGILRTNKGEFGPGTWVWFPEGLIAEHGATEDVDLDCIFVTNKPFDIDYNVEMPKED